MHDVKKSARRRRSEWQTTINAHTGRYKMTKEEYKTRKEELHKAAREEAKLIAERVMRTYF